MKDVEARRFFEVTYNCLFSVGREYSTVFCIQCTTELNNTLAND